MEVSFWISGLFENPYFLTLQDRSDLRMNSTKSDAISSDHVLFFSPKVEIDARALSSLFLSLSLTPIKSLPQLHTFQAKQYPRERDFRSLFSKDYRPAPITDTELSVSVSHFRFSLSHFYTSRLFSVASCRREIVTV